MVRNFNLLRLILFCALFPLFYVVEAQNLEFSEVHKLGSAVNTNAEELMPLFSARDNKLYFSRALYSRNNGGQFAGMDIWVSERTPTGWTKATNDLNGWNNKENNVLIGINNDGQVVYLMHTYGRGEGIAFSKHINGKWTSPELIPVKGLKDTGFKGFFMNEAYNILLISMAGKDSYGQEDIYVSLKQNGSWTAPENLGTTINTSEYEISPFISKDGRMLFFSSAGHEGYGNADIYVSERLYDGWTVWTKPKNLGNKINTPGFDAYFSMTSDSLAFFCSNYKSKYSDIYMARVTMAKYVPIADLNSMFGTFNYTSKKVYLTPSEIKNRLGIDVDMRVNFNRDSYEMDPSARERLYFLTSKLKSNPGIRLEMEGYGDFRANADVNERLIRRRITEVINYLRSNGIAVNRITVKELHVTDVDTNNARQVTIKLFQKPE